MPHQPDSAPSRTLDRFKRWFWRRPRAHGDTIRDRRASPLESLYDLVYAVQRQDRVERSEFAEATGRFVHGLVLSVVVMPLSAILPPRHASARGPRWRACGLCSW